MARQGKNNGNAAEQTQQALPVHSQKLAQQQQTRFLCAAFSLLSHSLWCALSMNYAHNESHQPAHSSFLPNKLAVHWNPHMGHYEFYIAFISMNVCTDTE
jgi:hypothetical protein